MSLHQVAFECSSEVHEDQGSGDGLPWPLLENHTIFRLLDNRHWRAAAAMLESDPKAVVAIDMSDGSTPLHCASLNDAPLELIDLLVKLDNKKATMVQDNDGWTPLHTACYFDASPCLVRRLIESNVRAVHVKDKKGSLPVHLVDKVMTQRFEVRVEEALADDEEWDDRMLVPNRDINGPNLLQHDEDLIQICHKAKLLIKAAYTGQCKGDLLNYDGVCTGHVQHQIVHALAGAPGCPEVFMKMGVKINAHQLAEADEDGNLPLHVAAMNPCTYYFNNETYHPLRHLVRKYHGAAIVPNHMGELPLHLALRHGKTWDNGVKELYEAFPSAISSIDPEGTFPFMMPGIASASHTGPRDQNTCLKVLATTFELLRAFPELTQMYVTVKSSQRLSNVNSTSPDHTEWEERPNKKFRGVSLVCS